MLKNKSESKIIKEYLRYRNQNREEIEKEQYSLSENGILFHSVDELKHFTNDDDDFKVSLLY